MSSSKTIGIIGGGQLGQMMAISAIYMGHKVIALAVMFSLMSLKMSTLTALTLLSKTVSSHKEQTCFAFHKTVSLRRTFSQTRLK